VKESGCIHHQLLCRWKPSHRITGDVAKVNSAPVIHRWKKFDFAAFYVQIVDILDDRVQVSTSEIGSTAVKGGEVALFPGLCL
jgi:hypothetical protein